MTEPQPMKNGRNRVFLSAEEYRLLVHNAPNYRAKLRLELMGLSVRVANLAEQQEEQNNG